MATTLFFLPQPTSKLNPTSFLYLKKISKHREFIQEVNEKQNYKKIFSSAHSSPKAYVYSIQSKVQLTDSVALIPTNQ